MLLSALTTALMLPSAGLAPTPGPVFAAQTPTSCPGSVSLANGGFEQPTVTNSQQLNQAQVPGWQTTATDHLIELWRTGFLGVPSGEGNQFAELNAAQVSTLFQDLTTTPGQQLFWRLKHRGRSGTETMALRIGPPAGPLVEIQQMSDGISAWGNYTGAYTVPAGQTRTRFAFVSVAPGGSSGNFLDDIQFGTPPCNLVTKTVTPTTAVAAGQVLTYRIKVVNQGGDASGSTVVTDSIPSGTTYVPGS